MSAVLLWAVVLAAAPEPAPPPRVAPLFLGYIEVVAPAGVHLADPGLRARLELNDSDPTRADPLRRWYPAATVAGGAATIAIGEYPAATDLPLPRHRAPSFVVDFDDPAVADLAKRAGATATPAVLAKLVGDHITNKSGSRGFDFASVVARRREGDCTEHAVLLTAVARAHGLAARVIKGLLLLEVEGRVGAVGHAWVEVHDGHAWQLVDATDSRGRYVPLSALEDEGPGFAASLERFSWKDVRRVVLEPAR